MQTEIFFDNNSTTKLDEMAMKYMMQFSHLPLNPSSIHNVGREARKLLEEARSKIATALGIKDQTRWRIVFCASGTEANNLALNNLEYKLFISSVEHSSISKKAANAEVIMVDSSGMLDLIDLEKKLSNATGKKLVSVIYAHNETGVVQDIKKISEICKKHNAILHTDAIQAFGKIDFDIEELGVDMMSISAHKCGGPVGASSLISRKNIDLHPIFLGGGQEQFSRPGTENVLAIIGFGYAAEKIKERVQKVEQLEKLKSHLELELTKIAPKTIIVGKDAANRLPNTTYAIMPYVKSEVQLINFDMEGIAVSAGSACSSGKIKTPSSLLSMGIDEKTAECGVRISLGIENNMDEVNQFLNCYKEIYNKLAA